MRKITSSFELKILPATLFLFVAVAAGQHRGDNLAFQGLANANVIGVKAIAMGGAYASITGDLEALFHNPAGLADLDHVQLSFSANAYDRGWRENQVYRPNRFLLTLPFYLEGLYVPNPANNGQWDYEIFERERDSTFVVNPPILGKDPFGEEAADWTRSVDGFVANNLAVAVPLNLAGRRIVLSAAWNRRYDLLDFDRNDTYLDPHVGYDEYGVAERVSNDTLRMNWYRFQRERSGKIQDLTAAVAYQVSQLLNLGLCFNSFSGDSDDRQLLDKVGWFDLARNNRLRFSYDTLATVTTGTSEYSARSFTIGAIFSFNRVNLGMSLTAPHTVKRTWDYATSVTDTLGTGSFARSGVDEMEIPATYTLGLSVLPIKQFLVSLDVEHTPYSKAEFRLAAKDSTHRDWVDRTILRFGLEFRPLTRLSLLAGYQSVPQTFVPDGAAFRDRGPAADSYSFGLSVGAFFGRVDAAYEIRRLKYYDSYYSNTNYVLETLNNLSVGVTLDF